MEAPILVSGFSQGVIVFPSKIFTQPSRSRLDSLNPELKNGIIVLPNTMDASTTNNPLKILNRVHPVLDTAVATLFGTGLCWDLSQFYAGYNGYIEDWLRI